MEVDFLSVQRRDLLTLPTTNAAQNRSLFDIIRQWARRPASNLTGNLRRIGLLNDSGRRNEFKPVHLRDDFPTEGVYPTIGELLQSRAGNTLFTAVDFPFNELSFYIAQSHPNSVPSRPNCSRCRGGRGSFKVCRQLKLNDGTKYMHGACISCLFDGRARECDSRTDSKHFHEIFMV